MRTSTRVLAAVASGCVLASAATSAAHALWSDDQSLKIPAVARGQVAFAAGATGATPVHSVDGAPVTVTVPGTQIAQVFDKDTVFWSFTATGTALGATGLTYDVSVGQQVADGERFDLVDGAARPGTALASSTLKIYPAGADADCSDVPATPAGDSPANVFVYDGTSHVLQQPGAARAGQANEQTWCAAVTLSTTLDGLGEYRNRVRVEALAEDATTSRDEDEWHVSLQPDPRDEPGLTIQLDPTVTHADPAVPPGDHHTRPVS